MTSERSFDRLARAWLELGPDEAPDRVIAAVLQAAETTPQVRRLTSRPPWRSLTMTRLRMSVAIAAVLVVAGTGAYLVSRNDMVGPAPTSTPSVAPSIPPASQPTTPGPPTGTPIPAASLVLTDSQVFAWEVSPGSSHVQFQVIATFRNQGPGWAQMVRAQGASFTLLDSAGNVTLDPGPFGYALPDYVGPGDVGYLFATTSWPDRTAADFATVDVSLRPASFRSVAPPNASSAFSDVTWRAAALGSGLEATGTVTTSGLGTLPFAYVAILCIGSGGSILGATTVTLQNLPPDRPTAFETVTATPPLELGACASAIGLVGDGVDQN